MALPEERRRLLPLLERRYAVAVAGYFRGMRPRIEPGIRRVLERRVETKAEPLETAIGIELGAVDWNAETRILSTTVRPVSVLIGDEAAAAVGRELRISGAIDLAPPPPSLSDVARRIRQVTATSQDRIGREIVAGLERGLSVEQIVRGIPPGATRLGDPLAPFRGIAGLVDSWSSTGTAGFAGATGSVPLRSSRAYLIALTETGNAFNTSAIDRYGASGLVDFVEVFDGPDCGWSSHQDPELAHGSIRTLAEARAHALAHPRCQRAFGARLDVTAPAPSPFQGRPPGNVPGATPGLRPTDTQPLSGRPVPVGPPAVSPFFGRGAAAPSGEAAREASLVAAGDRIRGTRTHETAVVVDDAGKVILDKSDPTKPRSVSFSDAEVRRMRGGTLTHNHPGAYQTDLPYATGFSPDDGALLLHAKLREFRAVGKGADHVLRIDHSIDPGDLRTKLGRLDRDVRDDFTYRIAGGELEIKVAEADHWYEVWTRLAKEWPGRVFYERTLRPGVG